MNFSHRLLIHCLIGCMVLGMLNFASASSLSREMTGVESSAWLSKWKNQKIVTGSNRVISPTVDGGCWKQFHQGPDIDFQTLQESGPGSCASRLGEEAGRMGSPECSIVRTSGNGISSGQCGVNKQLVSNFGHLIGYSSDQVFGQDGILENFSDPEKFLPRVISGNHQENESWNKLSPSIMLNHVPMTNAFGYDWKSLDLIDSENGAGGTPNFSFDHQLVISGKLAYLVPKVGQSPRSLELGDFVILLLFAMLPEKKHIKHLIHRTRQFRLF